MTNLVRIRKTDTKNNSFKKQDGLQLCIECWKFVMSSGTGYLEHLKEKPMGGMTANEDGYGNDLYEEQLKADTAIGNATNTEIHNLAPRLKWAMYKTCGIGQVMHFQLADLIHSYTQAETELTERLKKNNITAHLF